MSEVYYIGATGMYDIAMVAKTNKTPVKNDTVVDGALNALNTYTDAFMAAGFSTEATRNSLVQDYMESGGYSNSGFKKYGNPGNITYSSHDQWATKGGEMPGNPGYYWANYKTPADYANAKKRVLSLAPGKPIDGTDYPDFVHRLKLNNYFGKESEASYLKKLQDTAQRLRIIQNLVTDSHQDITTDAGAGGVEAWWKGLPTWEKGGFIGGSFLLLILAVKK